MYSVVRTYSGPGAKQLFDLIEQRQDDIESLIRSVTGLISYTLVPTSAGGVSVTVCQDKAGADESSKLARDWILENASDIDVSPPEVSEGPVAIQVN